MRQSLLQFLSCPKSGQDLELLDGVVDERGVRSGRLQTRDGRYTYPIERYVPRFVESESYAKSFGEEWTLFSRVQLDSANGTTISKRRFAALTGLEPEALRGKRVLEAGSGSGRFLEVLANAGAEVVGVDMSAAVEPSTENLKTQRNVDIVQADLTRLPFKPGTFDFIYSFGVLMCTPDTEASFRSLVPYLKPGGDVCIWVYGYRGPKWLPRPFHVYGYIAKQLPTPTLMKAIDAYAKVTLPLGRIPVVGPLFRLAFPVSDLTQKREGEDGWDGGRKFPDDLVYDWARLNTFDGFTPAFTKQHDFEEVTGWFEHAGLKDIRQRPTRVAVLGRKPE
jgi:SAM-dependent methyltransferase